MVADGKLLAGDADGAGRVELCSVDAEVDVGHERPEHEHAIAAFHVLTHRFHPHGPLVQPEVERVLFAENGLAQDRGGKRDAGFVDQRQGQFLEPETVDFHVGTDDRFCSGVQQGERLPQGLPERIGVARLPQYLRGV